MAWVLRNRWAMRPAHIIERPDRVRGRLTPLASRD